MMKSSQKFVFINSLLAFVSAFIITTIIHESGHFISYWLFGAHPVLYHNYVQTSDSNLSHVILIVSALAGPVISLVQGSIFGVLAARSRSNSAGSLMILWLSLCGFINFFGYLMLTPLTTRGDTGKVAELLHMPYLYRILIAVFGIALLIYLVLKIGKKFADFIPNGLEPAAKSKYVNALVLFPILAGSALNALLSFPIPVILSVIYPATSSFVILSSYGIILKSESQAPKDSLIGKRIFGPLIMITIVAVVLNRILTLGWG